MIAVVSEDRLTRQELGWLLMQEARGTAQALREGVTQLKMTQESPVNETPEVEVETMLDALDGAIEMLGELESSPLSGKDRRGRIDIAALLFSLAPQARISLEPGAGTEVFGVESDLRRMLGVLLGQPGTLGSNASSGVSIRREREWIRISVELGPEGTPRRDLEFRWLTRMALRQGGRVELERGKHSLILPADRASEKREIEQLRKELEQAQQLGAVYARELAEAFGSGHASSAPPESTGFTANRLDGLVELSTPLGRTLRQLVEGLRSDFKQLGALVAETHPAIVSIARRLSATQDLVIDLDRIAKCDLRRPSEEFDLAVQVRDIVGQLISRADRMGVRLEYQADSCKVLYAAPSVTELLIYSLISQAILATASGQSVVISLKTNDIDVSLCVEDGGPIVPESAFTALLRGVGDPQSLGRPAGLSWLVAGATAEKLGIRIALRTSATLRSEIHVNIPKIR